MISRSDNRPASEDDRRYNEPSALENAVTIPGEKRAKVGRKDVVIFRHEDLNTNGSEK